MKKLFLCSILVIGALNLVSWNTVDTPPTDEECWERADKKARGLARKYFLTYEAEHQIFVDEFDQCTGYKYDQ